jgi:hypothetical protein
MFGDHIVMTIRKASRLANMGCEGFQLVGGPSGDCQGWRMGDLSCKESPALSAGVDQVSAASTM